jgi:hypothetical protein
VFLQADEDGDGVLSFGDVQSFTRAVVKEGCVLSPWLRPLNSWLSKAAAADIFYALQKNIDETVIWGAFKSAYEDVLDALGVATAWVEQAEFTQAFALSQTGVGVVVVYPELQRVVNEMISKVVDTAGLAVHTEKLLGTSLPKLGRMTSSKHHAKPKHAPLKHEPPHKKPQAEDAVLRQISACAGEWVRAMTKAVYPEFETFFAERSIDPRELDDVPITARQWGQIATLSLDESKCRFYVLMCHVQSCLQRVQDTVREQVAAALANA